MALECYSLAGQICPSCCLLGGQHLGRSFFLVNDVVASGYCYADMLLQVVVKR